MSDQTHDPGLTVDEIVNELLDLFPGADYIDPETIEVERDGLRVQIIVRVVSE